MAMSIILIQNLLIKFFSNDYTDVFAKKFPFHCDHAVEECIIVQISKSVMKFGSIMALRVVKESSFKCPLNFSTSATASEELELMILEKPDYEASLGVDKKNWIQASSH